MALCGVFPLQPCTMGKNILVEKYNIALTPGLQLLTSRSLTTDTLETIAGGLTESRQGFSPLPSVATEVQKFLP